MWSRDQQKSLLKELIMAKLGSVHQYLIRKDCLRWLRTSIVERKRAYHGQARVKTSIVECVEQHQLGFFITLIVLPSGKKGLRRVKFSGKEFTEKETKNWWEENQLSIYIKYDIEGYENLNQDLLKK